MSRLDLIVHPVRSRIVAALAGRVLTTRQLARVLPEVPVASLYRHVRTLDEAGVIVRTEEKRVRGATERSYTLAERGGLIDPDTPMSGEERLGALANFCNVAVQAYRTYTEAGGEETAFANMRSLYLTEEEHRRLVQGIRDLLDPLDANPPGEGRLRRTVSLIDQPDFEPEADDNP